MTLTTTFRLLRKANACEDSYRKLRKALEGVKDNDPINLLTILDTLNLDDALWALRATQQNCDRVARLMAADFAAEVLPIWHKHDPSDNRPALAIQAAQGFANGLITAEQLAAADAAAWAAADAAAMASADAAAMAAAGAAGAASRAAAMAAAGAAGAAARAAAMAAAGAAGAAWAAAGAAARAAAWAAAMAAAWAAGRKQEEIFRTHLQEVEA